MFADMVGYTALMQEDERRAHDQRERQRQVVSEVVLRHHGATLQHYGDGSLSVFGSAVEAVECAVEIQRELRKEPAIPLRIGVHTGDIVHDGDEIYGDGVNVAARIEALSAPGGVLISGKVADEIKNHPSLPTVSLGEIALKNVKEPQRVFAVAGEGLGVPRPEDVTAGGGVVVVRPEGGVRRAGNPALVGLGAGEALIQNIKDRAVVQWSVLYLVTAWILVEIVKFLARHFAWSSMVQQSFALVAFSGFLVTLVVTWYHGERGRQRVRRTEVVVYTVLALATVGGLWMLPSQYQPTDAAQSAGVLPRMALDDRSSIAVLPFENLSVDDQNVYFASGLHDEVLTQLQKVAELRVISRTSVLEYADLETRPNVRTIAENLGVTYVTEASVQRMGDRLRVNVQLIDARTDDHIWAETYDREVNDAFDVQSEIARAIAGAVATSLTEDEWRALSGRPTADPEAYRLYLQGRDYLLHPGYHQENFTAAEVLFERAVALDPAFALAHAELSNVHGQQYWENFDHSPARLEAQRAEAEEALRLDPALPQAHVAMGWTHYVAGDYARALAEYGIALKGLPNDADVIARIGYTHRRLGNWPEVFAAFERATSLDPRSPNLFYDLGGHSFLSNRRYEEAVRAYARAEALAPDLYDAAIHRGHTYVHWRGELDTLRSVVARLPSNLRLPEIDLARADLALWSRDPEGLFRILRDTRIHAYETQLVYFPSSLYAGWARRLQGDDAAAAAAFDSARVTLEALIAQNPDDERLINSLGYAYAGLGRSQDAADSAVRAMRARQRAGLEISEAPARILAQANLPDLAVPYLEAMLKSHSPFSAWTMKMDPLLDPIREHTAFVALLRRFEGTR